MDNGLSKEEIKAVKNAYFRSWRKRNRDKIRKIQDKYWSKKAKEEQEKSQL